MISINKHIFEDPKSQISPTSRVASFSDEPHPRCRGAASRAPLRVPLLIPPGSCDNLCCRTLKHQTLKPELSLKSESNESMCCSAFCLSMVVTSTFNTHNDRSEPISCSTRGAATSGACGPTGSAGSAATSFRGHQGGQSYQGKWWLHSKDAEKNRCTTPCW